MEQVKQEQKHAWTFTIPLAPPLSMNSIYWIIYASKRVELKPEARLWKMNAKRAIPPIELSSATPRLRFSADFHAEWYYKNGSVRKLDLQNVLKLLIDAVCEKLGVGDEHIWEVGPFRKLHSVDAARIVVTVEELS